MSQGKNVSPDSPIISRPGAPAISAVGTSLVIHEWRGCGPSYMHIHRSDDEAWHVLEGSLRFRLADGEVDAPQEPRSSCPPVHRTHIGKLSRAAI
jgi:mannose-6-phosphate isomerase-like protein (cupin superfamily)